MIRFSLECAKGHAFDSWFGSNADYERLQDRGLVACSVCGDSKVSKAIMAPAVSLADQQKAHPLSAPATPAEQALREMRKKFEAEATDVGKNFATQARQMHDGDLPAKPIYGEAKIEDARALLEDGIPIAPLPWQKRREN